MKRVRIAVGAIWLSALLVGCGQQDTGGEAVPVNGTLEGEIEYGEIELPDGRVLECITINRGMGQSQWGGLDCNGWNQERPTSGEVVNP